MKTKVEEFIKKYQYQTGEEFISKEELEEFHFQKTSNTSERVLLNYLNLIQEKCREKWSTFNLNYCLSGLALLFLSIISLLVFLGVLNDNKVIDDLVLGKIIVSLVKDFFFMFIFYLFLIFTVNLKLTSSTWILSLFFNFNVIFKFKNQFYKTSILLKFLNNLLRKDYLIIFLSFLIPFSNSFVIRENNSLRFLLISYIFLDFYLKLCIYKLSLLSILSKIKQLILILILVRFSFVFYVCREELLSLNCTQTMFSTPFSKLNLMENSIFLNFSNNTTLYYSLFLIFNFICFISIFRFVSNNLNLKSTLINAKIKQLFHLKICILFFYMIIQLKLNINSNLNSDDSIRNVNDVLKIINLFLAKTIYILFLFVQTIIWCPRDEPDTDKPIFLEKRIKGLVLSFSLVLTMVMGESFLSIWIIIIIIYLYFSYTFSWLSSKKASTEYFN